MTVTPDTVKILKNILTFSCKSMKFSTKWYTKLCILVDPVLRNCVTKSNFRYCFKKRSKKALALKELITVIPMHLINVLVSGNEKTKVNAGLRESIFSRNVYATWTQRSVVVVFIGNTNSNMVLNRCDEGDKTKIT